MRAEERGQPILADIFGVVHQASPPAGKSVAVNHY